MIQIDRGIVPSIEIFEKTEKLDETIRENLLKHSFNPATDVVRRLNNEGSLFSKAEVETFKAILFFDNPKNFQNNTKARKFKAKEADLFKLYANKALKAVLKEMFHKKCAYCESTFISAAPADIEHFRPKKAIRIYKLDKGKGHLIYPGYYWLGVAWNNLLWSCQNCNRKNTVKYINETIERAAGKGNKFPLMNEGNRIKKYHANLAQEDTERLLIDPCQDNPSEYFIFKENGEVSIRPELRPDSLNYLKAKYSIDCYGLQREELVKERNKAVYQLKNRLKDLNRNLKLFFDEKREQNESDLKEIERNIAEIRSHFNPTEPYLAFKFALINNFEFVIDLEVAGLNRVELTNYRDIGYER